MKNLRKEGGKIALQNTYDSYLTINDKIKRDYPSSIYSTHYADLLS